MQILTRHNRVIDSTTTEYINMGSYAICQATGKTFYDCAITTVSEVPGDLELYDYYYIEGKFVREFPVAIYERFNVEQWEQVQGPGGSTRMKHTFQTKRPILAVYRYNENSTKYSLVTNVDIEVDPRYIQTIEATQAFAGYIVTL